MQSTMPCPAHHKILVIGPTPPPYHGVSVVTDMILSSKSPRSYRILHFDTSDRRSLTNIGKLDFPNIWLACRHTFELINVLHEKKPDIIYVPICQTIKGLMRDAVFIFLSKLKHAKIIIHLHGSYFRILFNKTNVFGKFLIKGICGAVSKAIVLGEDLKSIFKDLIPDDNIIVIPNGIDDKFSEKQDRTSVACKDNYKKVLYLSSLAKAKGYLDIVRAMPDVVKADGNTTFVFAGDYWSETDRRTCLSFIENQRLAQCVSHVGTVTGRKKLDLLLSSDIFVLPSHNEGQPLAILEAMSSGLPIIATDTGAIKDMVLNGKNGFIVEKERPDQIAEKICLLLKNNTLRQRMGKSSRERFLRYFTRDKFISALNRVFTDVVSA